MKLSRAELPKSRASAERDGDCLMSKKRHKGNRAMDHSVEETETVVRPLGAPQVPMGTERSSHPLAR